ncbi:hypothetical protein ACO0SA_000561 [Hanseniaspora valbyensis]
MSTAKRLMREINAAKNDKEANIELQFKDPNNITQLTGAFYGPEDTPYHNGKFIIDITIPTEYPFKPPIMKFHNKVYHPNISSVTGAICLDILKNKWSPVLTLKSTLISLQALLCDPAADDPQDAEVAKHYIKDRDSFNKTAKLWTEIYADPERLKQNGDLEEDEEEDDDDSSSSTSTSDSDNVNSDGAGDDSSEEITKKSKTSSDGSSITTSKYNNHSLKQNKKGRKLKDVKEGDLYGIESDLIDVFLEKGYKYTAIVSVLRRNGLKKKEELYDDLIDTLISQLDRE